MTLRTYVVEMGSGFMGQLLSHFRQSVNKVGRNTTTKEQHVTVFSLNVMFLINYLKYTKKSHL